MEEELVRRKDASMKIIQEQMKKSRLALKVCTCMHMRICLLACIWME